MSTLSYDTAYIHPSEQLAYWNEAICEVFTELKCERSNHNSQQSHVAKQGFYASLENWGLGRFNLAEVRSPSSLVQHTKQHVNQLNQEGLLLHLQTRGSSVNTQNDVQTVLQPGQFSMCVNTEPYQVDIHNYHEMLVVNIPLSNLRQHFSTLNMSRGISIDASNPLCQMIVNHIGTLWHNRLYQFDDTMLNSMTDTLLTLVSALVETSTKQNIIADTTIQKFHLLQIKNYIDEHLGSPDLSPGEVAKCTKLSPRYLRTLFHHMETTCSEYIMDKRLALAAEYLKSPVNHTQKVINVAFECGFKSPSHFNRAFKAKYGMTPKDYKFKALIRKC